MMWTDNKARHNLSHEAGRLRRAVLANKVCHTLQGTQVRNSPLSTQSGLSAPMNFSVLCKRGQHHQSLTISGVRSNEARVFRAVHMLIS